MKTASTNPCSATHLSINVGVQIRPTIMRFPTLVSLGNLGGALACCSMDQLHFEIVFLTIYLNNSFVNYGDLLVYVNCEEKK
jgi:hypothetical protein